MRSDAFHRAVKVDESGFLDRLLDWLGSRRVRWCVLGGRAVNAYVEPPVSLDLDLAVAGVELDALLSTLPYGIEAKRFPQSVILSAADSELRVQVQLDPRYAALVSQWPQSTFPEWISRKLKSFRSQ